MGRLSWRPRLFAPAWLARARPGSDDHDPCPGRRQQPEPGIGRELLHQLFARRRLGWFRRTRRAGLWFVRHGSPSLAGRHALFQRAPAPARSPSPPCRRRGLSNLWAICPDVCRCACPAIPSPLAFPGLAGTGTSGAASRRRSRSLSRSAAAAGTGDWPRAWLRAPCARAQRGPPRCPCRPRALSWWATYRRRSPWATCPRVFPPRGKTRQFLTTFTFSSTLGEVSSPPTHSARCSAAACAEFRPPPTRHTPGPPGAWAGFLRTLHGHKNGRESGDVRHCSKLLNFLDDLVGAQGLEPWTR
jgi:hypothetical protein